MSFNFFSSNSSRGAQVLAGSEVLAGSDLCRLHKVKAPGSGGKEPPGFKYCKCAAQLRTRTPRGHTKWEAEPGRICCRSLRCLGRQCPFSAVPQPATWSFLSCTGPEEGVTPCVLFSWKCPGGSETTTNTALGSEPAVHVPKCSPTLTPFGTERHSKRRVPCHARLHKPIPETPPKDPTPVQSALQWAVSVLPACHAPLSRHYTWVGFSSTWESLCPAQMPPPWRGFF